jgi:DNA-binding transcriptional LysR family regulator
MDNLPALRSLVAALDHGSFSAAARSLKISQPAVSQHIAALEAGYGQPLLHRSRQGVRPTDAGQLAVDHARRALANLDALRDDLAALRGALTGRLRIACPTFLAEHLLVPIVARLRQAHPGFRLDLLSEDRLIDLDAEAVDLAFRAGSPGGGGGTVRRIADLATCLVASPEFVVREGTPQGLNDLIKLSYIQYKDDPGEVAIPLMTPGGTVNAPVRPAFAAQMSHLILHAARNHMGFIRVARGFVTEDLASGRLVELLPETPPESKPLYMVCATAFQASRRSDVFLGEVDAVLQSAPGIKRLGPPLASRDGV